MKTVARGGEACTDELVATALLAANRRENRFRALRVEPDPAAVAEPSKSALTGRGRCLVVFTAL